MTASGDRSEWPRAELDPVRRLHVLDATMAGLHVVERLIPAPFADVWHVASDIERELPRLGGGFVTALRITERDGERIVARVEGPFGIRDTFAITLRPGWCWMEGRLLSAAMAAAEADGGTRFAWATRLKVPGGRFASPASSYALRRTLERLETRVLARRTGADPASDG